MTIAGKILRFIANIFKGFKAEVKHLVLIAISIVEAVKSVIDGPVDDVVLSIIEKVIPGDADDVLIEKIKNAVKSALPVILERLLKIKEIANIEDSESRMKVIIEEIKKLDTIDKDILCHNAAFLLIQELGEGQISWSQSILASETGYIKPKLFS